MISDTMTVVNRCHYITMSLEKCPTYSPELIERMLDLHAQGKTITSICRIKGMPAATTFAAWCKRDPSIMQRFREINAVFADALVDETLTIADTALDAQRARNQITARQWIASRLNSAKYGDKVQVEVEHKLNLASVLNAAKARISRPEEKNTIDATFQVIDNDAENAARSQVQISGAPTSSEETDGFSILD